MTVCPKCNGRGTVGYYHIDHFVDIECDRCHGSGEVSEVEMTNEEYLKSCDTEQLADVLWEQINGAFNSGYACCNLKQDKDYISRYKRFKEWLKQPHTKGDSE